MNFGKIFTVMGWVMLITAMVFLGRGCYELWYKNWWFLGHFAAALFFLCWASGLFGLAIKSFEEQLEAAKKAQEANSMKLSDQFGSFRDLGRR